MSHFFFQTHGNQRSLHSFPTRRSSDRMHPAGLPRPWHHAGGSGELQEIQRSVEHTSELQSHHDLVCRLLLEKKKLRGSPGARTCATKPDLHRLLRKTTR